MVGSTRQDQGPSLSPLHRGAPEAALADRALYELLALLDALRVGCSRERTLAAIGTSEQASAAAWVE